MPNACPHCHAGYLVVEYLVTYAHTCEIHRCVMCGFTAERLTLDRTEQDCPHSRRD